MEDISHLVEVLCSSLTLEKSLFRLFTVLNQKLDADGVFINFFDRSKQAVSFLGHINRAGIQPLPAPIKVPSYFFQKLKKERGAVLCIQEITDDPFTQYVLSQAIPEVKSFLMLDLFKDEKHLGVVCFYSQFGHHFCEKQAELLQRLHDPLALVTCNALNTFLLKENSQLGKEKSKLLESLEIEKRKPIVNFLKHSPSLSSIAEQIEKIAPTEATVLVLGETGTGKEVIADLIHSMSSRSNGPLVKINCGAISDNLLDSELFGYEKGAFTDAKQTRKGFFEQADSGTLFLDEIGELTPSAQVRLLRTLQQKTIIRVGGTKEIQVNVRVVAATHRNLQQMVKDGTFREDLWFRLNVYPISIPPLRERGEDAVLLSELFLGKLKDKYGLKIKPVLSSHSIEFLRNYAWPGNVRELENSLERAVLSSQSSQIELKQVLFNSSAIRAKEGNNGCASTSYEDTVRQYFLSLLHHVKGKISGPGGAAEIAKMHPNTLRSKLKKLNIHY